MSITLKFTAWSAAIGLVVISVTVNATFGTQLASGYERWLFAAAFGTMDMLKVCLLPIAAFSFTAGNLARGRIAIGLFVLLSILSFTAGVGLYSMTKASTTGDAKAVHVGYKSAIEERARLESQIAKLRDLRLRGEVEADIATRKLHPIYTRSSACKDVTRDDSRSFCSGLNQLNAELAKVAERESLTAKRDAINLRLNKIDTAKAMRPVDPQGETLARLVDPFVSVEVDTIRTALAVLISLLIEAGSGFGLWLVSDLPNRQVDRQSQVVGRVVDTRNGTRTHIRTPADKSAPPPKPDATEDCTVSKWLGSGLMKRSGGAVLARDVLEAYRDYCGRFGLVALNQAALGARLTELGYSKRKRHGLVEYLDVALCGKPALTVVSA